MLVARQEKVVEQNEGQIWTPRRKLSLTWEFRANRQEVFHPPLKIDVYLFVTDLAESWVGG